VHVCTCMYVCVCMHVCVCVHACMCELSNAGLAHLMPNLDAQEVRACACVYVHVCVCMHVGVESSLLDVKPN
jgi:hypothetical protein